MIQQVTQHGLKARILLRDKIDSLDSSRGGQCREKTRRGVRGPSGRGMQVPGPFFLGPGPALSPARIESRGENEADRKLR